MINPKQESYLRGSLWLCLYLILLTPLLIGSDFLFPFISLKTFYFRFLVELSLFIYLLLAVSCPSYRPKLNKLTLAVLVFGLLVFLTGLIGVNPYRSFWGTIERGEGFLTISHIIIYFFILAHAFPGKRQWLNYFSASVLISVLVGLYALGQKFTQLPWIVGAGDGRLSSTLGNPAYLGAYALGHLWLCALLFFERKKIVWRLIFSLLGLFEFYLLWQSSTRGALIGLVVALLFFVIALGFLSKRRKTKIVSLGLILLICFGALLVWTNRQSNWVVQSGTLHRLTTISLKDITTQSRLFAWDSSWQGWKDRFLVGYGWENYNIAFNQYFHPEIFRDNGSQIWFDRAHNTLFDVAVATGLGGLVVYLIIFGAAIFYLFRFLRRDPDNLILYLLTISFLLGHFIQNFFVFDCLATYIMLFMVLAFIGFIINKHHPKKEASQLTPNRPLNYWVLGGGLIILLLAGFYFNLQPAKANITGLQGLKYFYQGQTDRGLDEMLAAINLHTYQTPEIRQKLTDNAIGLDKSAYPENQESLQKAFSLAEQETQKNISQAPRDVQNYLYLMILYNAYSFMDHSLPGQVLRLGDIALKLSPTRPQIYFEMGQAAINSGSPKQGLGYFQKGMELNPENLDSAWLLLTAYIVTGDYQSAAGQYQAMLGLGLTENAQNLERVTRLYETVKKYDRVVYFCQKLIALKPDNLDYWTKLLAALDAQGDPALSEQTLSALLKQYPTMAARLSALGNKK